MGYFINGSDIAKATIKPAKVSLVGNPNYIQFEANVAAKGKPVEIQLKLTGCGYVFIRPDVQGIKIYENISSFSIIEAESGIEHKFEGTSDPDKLNEPGAFYLGKYNEYSGPAWQYEYHNTALALKEGLEKNEFFKNFKISISPDDNKTINIVSNGSGKEYVFSFVFRKNSNGRDRTFFGVAGNPAETYPAGTDTIAIGYDNVGIHLDMYKDTGIFLGEDDTPSDSNMGTKAITLTKAYSYTPLWFNTNILENNTIPTTFLKAEDWVDTGTIKDFRFTAKRVITDKTVSHTTPFYHSSVLYSIAGYNRTLEKNDLSDYVFDTKERFKNVEAIKRVKPLTNQPQLFHIKGQTQYFNFILSDAEHSKSIGDEYRFGICYELLSQSGQMIAKETKHLKARKDFFMVNTIKLDIDSLLHQYPNTGLVRAYLIYSVYESQAVQISHELTFGILPECLYKIKDFAFLNRLGGWSSFNFSETEHTDFKAEANTIFKTQTPHFTTSSDIESVYSKTVTEQFTVQTMPVRRDVCNWLKEMSASRMVYELATQRYIIVDEMNIKPNSKDELYRVEMKYHYSDSYN